MFKICISSIYNFKPDTADLETDFTAKLTYHGNRTLLFLDAMGLYGEQGCYTEVSITFYKNTTT